MGCDPALIEQPGVTVKGSPDRAENHVTAGYTVGEHFFIPCDPAVEAMLTDAVAAASMEPTLDGFNALAAVQGGELLGVGRMQLHTGDALPDVALAEGYTMRSLDYRDEADVALIARLVEISDEDDLDEAEIELDNLDDLIEVVLDPAGEIASFGSSRDFDMSPGFGDIGIMTRPDCRGFGLGSAAVVAVSHRIRAQGDEPLYRCDEDNAGSIALSRGLGFSIATKLSAFRFATN